MKVLVACEFSGIVRDAFIAQGHESYSCDLLESESRGGPHLQCNVLDCLNWGWDLMIAHPPCTYLTLATNRWHVLDPSRGPKREAALEFFVKLLDANIPRICIENPIGVTSTRVCKPTQIIQPYQFGHEDRKPTCLWLKGLAPLLPTKIVKPKIFVYASGRSMSLHHARSPSKDKWKFRSRTYQGIADAMAYQWSNQYVLVQDIWYNQDFRGRLTDDAGSPLTKLA